MVATYCIMSGMMRPLTVIALSRPIVRFVQHHRRELTTSERIRPIVYRSRCTDPWKNLAFEDWIFREVDVSRQNVLILWLNEPSVVIGRNQNPWTECNLPLMEANGINFVRRKSGGGTVYHDLGNINLTFMTSRDRYVKTRYTNLIAQALQRDFDIPALVNDRNDLVLNGNKISGSAYKLGGKAAYHHCTLLVSSDIPTVRKYLQPCRDNMVTKGVESVRSPVSTLHAARPGITVEEVFESIASAFADQDLPPMIEVDPSDLGARPELVKYYEELKSWDWMLGQTPIFTQRASYQMGSSQVELELECRRGRVFEARLTASGASIPDTHLRKLEEALVGCRYGTAEDSAAALGNIAGAQQDVKALAEWLKTIVG